MQKIIFVFTFKNYAKLKLVLVFFALFFVQLSISQSYLEFNKHGLNSQSEQLDYINKQIDLHKAWNARKIEMVCLKSSLLNRVGSYTESESLLKTIPVKEVVSNNCEGVFYLTMAVVDKYLGYTEKAYNEFKKARQNFKKNKNYCELVDEFTEEAEFHRKNSQFVLAVDCIDSALHYYEKAKCDSKVKVKVLNRFAAISNEYPVQGKTCIDLSIKTIQLARKVGEKYWLAVSYNEIGSAYNADNQVDSAQFYSELAEKEFRKLDLLQDAMHAKLGRAFHARNNEKSIELLEEIVKETKAKKINYSLLIVYARLKDLYNNTGQYQLSIKNFENFNEVWSTGLRKEQAIELAKIEDDFKSQKLLVENDKIKLLIQRDQEKLKNQKVLFFSIMIFTIFLVVFIFILLVNSRIKKKLNAELKIKNQEKDVLMKEIHHRVKNNLQYVQSILFFQTMEEEGDNQTLNDISRRINAISLVHEMLYSNVETDKIAIKEYLEKLIFHNENLFSSNNKFKVDLIIEDVLLPIKKMESIGMICSELLNNFIKHAKAVSGELKFSIEFKKVENDNYLLSIYDNGLEEIVGQPKEGLGIKLIDIFSRQLKGEYLLDRKNGYKYQLNFKIK